VPQPTFSQPERRSYALPILLAVVLLAVAAAVALHFFPATSIESAHLHTDILPTHTVFKSDSIVVGPPQTSDVLFVASTIRVENKLRIPISLDGLSCTFTDPSGAVLTVKGVTRQDLANTEASFPGLKPLMAMPLRLDANLDPGQTTQGTVLLSFPFTREQWDTRKSATLQVDVYNHPPLFIDIPK
jgi:hypothetical protein